MAKISIKQIAELTNLSPGTISIVLNGRGDEMRISKATQARVWESAKQVGYQPNINARRLRQQSGIHSTTLIAVLWPSLYSGELLVRFFDGIQHAILREDFNIEIVYKPYIFNEMFRLDDMFRSNPFNGVIIVGASSQDVEFVREIACNMPIVFFNRQDSRFHSVVVDDYNSGEKVAALFAARGHKHVGLIDADIANRPSMLRRAGFLAGCQELGLQIAPEHMLSDHFNDMHDAAARLLACPVKPTALFLTIGTAARDIYEVFQQAGVQIPEDIEIIGSADTQINHLLRPALTVIDLPLEDMVLNCLQLILDSIAGQSSRAMNIMLETQFIIRQSCGGFPDKPMEA